MALLTRSKKLLSADDKTMPPPLPARHPSVASKPTKYQNTDSGHSNGLGRGPERRMGVPQSDTLNRLSGGRQLTDGGGGRDPRPAPNTRAGAGEPAPHNASKQRRRSESNRCI